MTCPSCGNPPVPFELPGASEAVGAFGLLPTPLRMRADPRYTGRGVTMALVDSGFHPHPDLVLPANRIRAWADASDDPVRWRTFDPGETPAWPGSDLSSPEQWHGLMTSVVAGGNGWLSHGLYRGLASGSELVLVQARQPDGRIPDAAIARALRWLCDRAGDLSLRIVSLSVGGDRLAEPGGNAVDEAVAALVADGVTVIAAAGNDGQRRLVPPATAPEALTIGGIDDKNTFDPAEVRLWHSNYGPSTDGLFKPELVAPSIWVVAPLLPGTAKAEHAARLFGLRGQEVESQEAVEKEISELKLVTPHYHHVDGTSVAAPLVAGVAACMLQANPRLTPPLVRRVLLAAARPVPGAPRERQGAGAIDAGQAVALALREPMGS